MEQSVRVLFQTKKISKFRRTANRLVAITQLRARAFPFLYQVDEPEPIFSSLFLPFSIFFRALAMGKTGFLAMKTDELSSALLETDLRELAIAAQKLADHALVLGTSLGVVTTFLRFLASAAAIYLLVLDRTNWKTNMLTSLLIPYIFLSLPSIVFSLLRGQVGCWIAFVTVVLRLFFPRHFPDWLELPASLILLLVVAPSLLAGAHVRGGIIGVAICIVIGCYLLQEHIRASGGFRNSFTKKNGISNSIGIILLLVYPVWRAVMFIL